MFKFFLCMCALFTVVSCASQVPSDSLIIKNGTVEDLDEAWYKDYADAREQQDMALERVRALAAPQPPFILATDFGPWDKFTVFKIPGIRILLWFWVSTDQINLNLVEVIDMPDGSVRITHDEQILVIDTRTSNPAFFKEIGDYRLTLYPAYSYTWDSTPYRDCIWITGRRR